MAPEAEVFRRSLILPGTCSAGAEILRFPLSGEGELSSQAVRPHQEIRVEIVDFTGDGAPAPAGKIPGEPTHPAANV